MNKLKHYLFFVITFYVIHFFLVKNLPNFWDNILFSAKVPLHFYESGMFNFKIPENIDSGHPPFWSWLIALNWKILGKTLVAGHFLMIPFLVFNAYLFIKILKEFTSILIFPALILFVLEPTYLAQSTMISLEIALISGFLLMYYSYLKDKKLLLIVATVFLALISQRGAVLVFGFALFHFLSKYKKEGFFNVLKLYLLAGFLFISYYVFHYFLTGYLLQSENSGWNNNIQFSSISLMFKQLGIVIWRFIDFGRITILISATTLLYFFYKKNNFKHHKFNSLILLFGIEFFILIAASVLISNPILHRYYLPLYILIIIIFIYLLSNLSFSKSVKNTIIALTFVSFIFGHFIIYNDKTAQGWDASLAHIPFFALKEKMDNYMIAHNISAKKTITEFPMVNGLYYSDLQKERNDFVPYDRNNFKTYKYFMQSNIMNDISDEDLNYLKQNCEIEYQVNKNGVYITLYQIK